MSDQKQYEEWTELGWADNQIEQFKKEHDEAYAQACQHIPDLTWVDYVKSRQRANETQIIKRQRKCMRLLLKLDKQKSRAPKPETLYEYYYSPNEARKLLGKEAE